MVLMCRKYCTSLAAWSSQTRSELSAMFLGMLWSLQCSTNWTMRCLMEMQSTPGSLATTCPLISRQVHHVLGANMGSRTVSCFFFQLD